MNYMRQVAEILGVEMGEKFKIDGFDGDFYFSNDGINDEEIDDIIHSGLLEKLLDGTSKIIKKPWKPKFGEIYHFVTTGGAIAQMACTECTFDCALALMGNRFRTEAEAKPHVDEMVAKMRAVME